MSTLVDQAWNELKQLPTDEQDAIARDLLEMLRADRRWDQAFVDPRSEALFDRMAAKVRGEIAAGRTIPADPSDRDAP
jgi:hypothetical protein